MTMARRRDPRVTKIIMPAIRGMLTIDPRHVAKHVLADVLEQCDVSVTVDDVDKAICGGAGTGFA